MPAGFLLHLHAWLCLGNPCIIVYIYGFFCQGGISLILDTLTFGAGYFWGALLSKRRRSGGYAKAWETVPCSSLQSEKAQSLRPSTKTLHLTVCLPFRYCWLPMSGGFW